MSLRAEQTKAEEVAIGLAVYAVEDLLCRLRKFNATDAIWEAAQDEGIDSMSITEALSRITFGFPWDR